MQNIIELLEELDNNLEMAKEILEEECGQIKIVSEERPKRVLP